jgi:hypothetical protein
MTEQEKPVRPKYTPDLNRKGVGDWSGGKSSNLIRYDDFGLYQLAFKRWHFIPGERANSYWACTAKVLRALPIAPPDLPASEVDPKTKLLKAQVDEKVFQAALNRCRFDPTLPGFKTSPREGKPQDRTVFTPGVECTLLFTVNSPPTAKQPDVDKIREREDRSIKVFLEAMLAQALDRTKPIDWKEIFDSIEALGRVEHDNLTFACKCVPIAKRNEIIDPSTGEVLKLSCTINGNRYFDPWSPEAPAAQ